MTCPHCHRPIWSAQQRYQYALMVRGLCVECKQDNPAGGWFCSRCKAMRAAKQRDRRARQRQRKAAA